MRNRCRVSIGVSVAVTLSLAFLSSAVVGQVVFKCKDADGKVTYTDVPCLRSETTAFVDARANVADNSSLRKQAALLQSTGATAVPPGQVQVTGPVAAPPAPAPSGDARSGGYSR